MTLYIYLFLRHSILIQYALFSVSTWAWGRCDILENCFPLPQEQMEMQIGSKHLWVCVWHDKKSSYFISVGFTLGSRNEKLWDERNEHLAVGWDWELDPIFADSVLDNLNLLQSSKQKGLTQIFSRKMLSTVALLYKFNEW